MLAFIILLLAFLSLATGCSKAEETATKTYSYRWFDRKIYFAKSDATDVNRNNYFHKERIKDALKELSSSTSLGDGYTQFEEVDESELLPIIKKTATTEDQKSFILIWPDDVFQVFAYQNFGSTTPDQNAVAVINAANKRQFFIIFKASCFTSASSMCGNISIGGSKALVFRQMGLLIGLDLKECQYFPNDVMCADAKDSQYNIDNRRAFFNAYQNVLEAILNDTQFYSSKAHGSGAGAQATFEQLSTRALSEEGE